jgi:hypothetical protein
MAISFSTAAILLLSPLPGQLKLRVSIAFKGGVGSDTSLCVSCIEKGWRRKTKAPNWRTADRSQDRRETELRRLVSQAAAQSELPDLAAALIALGPTDDSAASTIFAHEYQPQYATVLWYSFLSYLNTL